ncbi:hypothetical protein LguiB_005820 [Lonicera macranthoides]
MESQEDFLKCGTLKSRRKHDTNFLVGDMPGLPENEHFVVIFTTIIVLFAPTPITTVGFRLLPSLPLPFCVGSQLTSRRMQGDLGQKQKGRKRKSQDNWIKFDFEGLIEAGGGSGKSRWPSLSENTRQMPSSGENKDIGAVGKFHHPRERLIPAPECVLSPIGLPLRPLAPSSFSTHALSLTLEGLTEAGGGSGKSRRLSLSQATRYMPCCGDKNNIGTVG